MKEQDLKRCFSKIKPSESLIRSTTEKIGELGTAREKTGFRFSYRLASAMCALVLVIGLGVAVLYNPTMIPTAESTESSAPMSLVSGRTSDDGADLVMAATCDTAVLERMTEDGMAEGGEYAVFFGSFDGCYFGEVTPEDKEQGVMYHCTLTFTVSAVSYGASAVPGDSVQADICVYDTDTIDNILNLTAGHVYVRLACENGEWVVRELLPYTE